MGDEQDRLRSVLVGAVDALERGNIEEAKSITEGVRKRAEALNADESQAEGNGPDYLGYVLGQPEMRDRQDKEELGVDPVEVMARYTALKDPMTREAFVKKVVAEQSRDFWRALCFWAAVFGAGGGIGIGYLIWGQ